jgi:hypothetical protein
MCWTMRSIATMLSAPRGTITSAYFFVGMQNSSNAGFTGNNNNVDFKCRLCSPSILIILLMNFKINKENSKQLTSIINWLYPKRNTFNLFDSGFRIRTRIVFGSWIRIRFRVKIWTWIRNKVVPVRIQNPGKFDLF